nr:MAG: replication initiator protein [Microvirus sp.]
MPCYHPLKGYKSIELTKNGKRKLVFSSKAGYVDLPIEVPCGNCIGCRIDRSRQWAIRCEHEMQLHAQNCFITLTYAPEHLPPGGSLVVKDFQDFMKRFRRRVTNPDDKFFVSSDFKLRFFHCGEYGDKLGRPHYHAIIFGYDFPDKVFLQDRKHGNVIYRSSFLEELWSKGHSSVGTATWQSAAYVARYVMKKVTGELSDDHYRVVDPSTGEVFDRKPEYTTMSRRPGIGKAWFDKYMSDVYPRGEVITKAGKRMKPPKYYDNQYELIDSDDMSRLKHERRAAAVLRKDDNTPERLEVREKVHQARISMLKREL